RVRPAAIEQPRADTPIPLEEEGEELTVGQTFTLHESTTACAVRMKFGTYREAHAGAAVRLLLTGPDGVSADATVPGGAITDNAWADFVLPELSLPPGDYSLRVGLAGPPATPLAVWSSRRDASYPGGTRLAGNAVAGGDLTFKLFSCAADPSAGWHLARSNEHLLVLENTDATSGAFLMAPDAPPAAAPLPGGVRLRAHTGSTRRYEVTTNEPALLVRAARFWPGFRATVDGVPAAVSSYAALFQAVAVPAGTHVVEIRYVPTFGWLGVFLSSLGALTLVLLVVPRRQRLTSTP
ncbi:MAG TPA: hypothetical protein VF395_04295, partial [Polyangiaceae bacterium]